MPATDGPAIQGPTEGWNRALSSRRELFRRGGALLAAGALAPLVDACGGSAPSHQGVGGTLHFLSFEGYDYPKAMKTWEGTHNVQLSTSFVGSNDDIRAGAIAAQRSGSPLDLITYYQGYGDEYRKLGIVTPLDEAKIPNLKGLFPFFSGKLGNFWVTPDGKRWAVPMTFIWMGLTYDTATVPKPTSYDMMLEPKYKGKLTLVADIIGIYTTLANKFNIDITKMSHSDLARIEDFIRPMLKQTKGLAQSYGDMATKLASGDALLAFPGWPALHALCAQSGKKTIQTAIPGDEGGYTAVDAWAIPPTTANRDTAYAWINATLEPSINAAEQNFLLAGTVVKDAVPLLTPGVRATIPYNDLEALLAKSPLFGNPPVESTQYVTVKEMNQSWQTLAAGV